MIESPAVDAPTGVHSSHCVLYAITSPDGTSRVGLRKAARLAGALGAELELFCRAFDPALVHPGRPNLHTAEEDIRDYLERWRSQLWPVVKDLRAMGLAVHSNVEWHSHAAEAIIREVLRRRPAYVVVESRLPDQAESRLIEMCPCPLLLIRNSRPYPAHPIVVAAVDPMHAHAKPAALDEAIVAAACEVAKALSGELHLFHARVPWATACHQARGPSWVPDVAKDENQVAYEHEVASRVAELANCHDVPCLRTHLVDGDITKSLPSFSHADAVDIVAMGALSRSLLERIVVGDTARRLLEGLECDVLIVKPPGVPGETHLKSTLEPGEPS